MKNGHLKNELINHHVLAIHRAFSEIPKVTFHVFCGQELQNIITLCLFYLHSNFCSLRNIIIGQLLLVVVSALPFFLKQHCALEVSELSDLLQALSIHTRFAQGLLLG